MIKQKVKIVKRYDHAIKDFPIDVNAFLLQNICRELWCSNGTHAMRAHPALDGTGCSEKPHGFGSVSFCLFR